MIEFSSELRADWYAKGQPADHDYKRWLDQAKDAKPSNEGLVTFSDGSRYGGSN